MTQYDNNMTAVLFKNDRKEQDTHADYNGNATVDGKEYWLNAWVKESKNGKKFFSLSFTEKKPKAQHIEPASTPVQQDDDMDMDIPF